jgi:hypothetical protein
MRERAVKGSFVGCVVVLLCFLAGATLAFFGYDNIKTRSANKEIHRTSLAELVNLPVEPPRWVEVSGVPVEGSHGTLYTVGFVLLLDPESKVAVHVMLNKASPLLAGGGERRVVRGMVTAVSEGTVSLPTLNAPPDVKVANLLLAEDDAPPGLLTSWGFVVLGVLLSLVAPTLRMFFLRWS